MHGMPYMYIIQCKFLFLFIGWEPTMWPANSCLQNNNGLLMHNVVQVCLAANNILLMHKWNQAFLLLAITVAWKCRLLRFPKIFIKNKLGNQMIKQFLNSVIAKYYDLSASKLKAEANNWSAQPHPILVNNQKVRKEILSSQYDSSIVFWRKNRQHWRVCIIGTLSL